MFEAVAAVERGGSFIFGLGFKTVAARGDAFLDEFKKFGPDAAPSVFFFDVNLLDPNHASARLLRVSVGEDAVAEDVFILLKDEGVTVWRTFKEKIKGCGYVFLGNIFKHRGRGIKILRHFGVDVFVVLCDFSDCHCQQIRLCVFPAKNSLMFSAILLTQRLRASYEPHAMCGVRQTFGRSRMAEKG